MDEREKKEELTAEEMKRLRGYQALCRGIGIDPSNSIPECYRRLKDTLVNIVDLIDARRTGKRVKVWENPREFWADTRLDKNRLNGREANRAPGYLAPLLKRSPASRWTHGKRTAPNRGPGRINKRNARPYPRRQRPLPY
ncbi:hypothetical protein B0I37DRAFT_380877 [Chaetomium sp. MPI-CAGE-AT-0009]|nr:hypothetical protein B0I37DRAFT_380877 [Chaetomium sp. MPI-CAGE-AT-0009]